MRIRRALPRDADALMGLVAPFHEHERIPTGDGTLSALQGLLADSRLGFVLVAEAARSPDLPDAPGQAVGYAVVGFGYSLEFEGRDAFLDELFVAPGWRGQGVGGQLLETVQAVCQASGIRALHLEVGHGNAQALRLYQTLGFRAHERHLMTKWLPGQELPGEA